MLKVKIGRRIYPHYDVIINKPLFTSREDFDRYVYMCVCVCACIDNKVKDWKRVMGVATFIHILYIPYEKQLFGALQASTSLCKHDQREEEAYTKRLFLHTIGG